MGCINEVQEVMTKVVNLCHEPYDIYIGRPSKYGNPFVIGKDGNRAEVIYKYRQYLLTHNDLLLEMDELKDKHLGCFCKPLACHGDVLVEMCERLYPSNNAKTK